MPNCFRLDLEKIGDSAIAAKFVDDSVGGSQHLHGPTLSKIFGNASPKKLSWRNYLEAAILPAMMPDHDTIDETARRLIALRYYAGCGDSQTRFALNYGFTVKQWNNFERGSPLSKDAAIQLVRRFPGLTLDWLHLGKPDGLPGTLRAELEAAGNAAMSADETKRNR